MQNLDRSSSSNSKQFILQKKDGHSRTLQLVYESKTRSPSQYPPGRPTMAGRPPGSVNIVAGAMFGVNPKHLPPHQRAHLSTSGVPASAVSSNSSFQSNFLSRQRNSSSSSGNRLMQHSPNEGVESPPALDRVEHDSDADESEEHFERRIQAKIESNILEERKRFEQQKKQNSSGNVINVEGQSIEEFEVDDLEKVMEEEEKSKRRMLEESNQLVNATTKLKCPKRIDKYQKTDEELQEQNEKIHAILENAKSQMNEEDKKANSSAGSSSSVSNSRKRTKKSVTPTVAVVAASSVGSSPEESVGVSAKKGRGKYSRYKKEKDHEGTSTANSSDYEEETKKKKKSVRSNVRHNVAIPVDSTPSPVPEKVVAERDRRGQNRKSELDRLLGMDFGPKEGGTLKDLEDAKTGCPQRRAALALNRKFNYTIPSSRRSSKRSSAGSDGCRYTAGETPKKEKSESAQVTPEKLELDDTESEVPEDNDTEMKEEAIVDEHREAAVPQSPSRDADDEKETQDNVEDEKMDIKEPEEEQNTETEVKPLSRIEAVVTSPSAPVLDPLHAAPTVHSTPPVHATPPYTPVTPTNPVTPVPAARLTPPTAVDRAAIPGASNSDGTGPVVENKLDYLPPGCTVNYRLWTVPQCVDWITVVTSSTAAGNAFANEEIDGEMLEMVPIDDYRNQMHMPYGPFVKTRNAIARLRQRLHDFENQ